MAEVDRKFSIIPVEPFTKKGSLFNYLEHHSPRSEWRLINYETDGQSYFVTWERVNG